MFIVIPCRTTYTEVVYYDQKKKFFNPNEEVKKNYKEKKTFMFTL